MVLPRQPSRGVNTLKLLSAPWFHFLLMGSCLFLLQGFLWPEPPPRVGPLAEARIETLKRQWLTTTGRMPSPSELSSMVATELDREMLFQEALSLDLHRLDPVVEQRLLRNMRFLNLDDGQGEQALLDAAWRMDLHLGDEVVRRRLIQLMEQLLLVRHPPAEVTDAALRQRYAALADELVLPPRYTLQHVYLPGDRSEQAAALLARFREKDVNPAVALKHGAPFLSGYRFVSRTPEQLSRDFGTAFVTNLEQLSAQAVGWVGPVYSTYGVHLVYLEQRQPGRPLTFAESRDRLERELVYEYRREALAAAVSELRENYEVQL